MLRSRDITWHGHLMEKVKILVSVRVLVVVWVMVVFRVMVRVRVEVLIFPPESLKNLYKDTLSSRAALGLPALGRVRRASKGILHTTKECVKVSHVIFECRVINHHHILKGPRQLI